MQDAEFVNIENHAYVAATARAATVRSVLPHSYKQRFDKLSDNERYKIVQAADIEKAVEDADVWDREYDRLAAQRDKVLNSLYAGTYEEIHWEGSDRIIDFTNTGHVVGEIDAVEYHYVTNAGEERLSTQERIIFHEAIAGTVVFESEIEQASLQWDRRNIRIGQLGSEMIDACYQQPSCAAASSVSHHSSRRGGSSQAIPSGTPSSSRSQNRGFSRRGGR